MILAPTLSLLSSGSGAIVRPTFSRDFAGEKTLNNGTGPAITFTRGSVGTFFDAAGVLQTASNDVPRFDHDPATGASRGLLIEESRQNLFERSKEFDNAYWTKINTTVTANAVAAPDGTITADAVFETVDNAGHVVLKVIFATDSVCTLSVFAKANGRSKFALQVGGEQTANFDLTAVTATPVAPTGSPSASIQSVGNGWFRCSATRQSTVNGNAIIVLLDNSGNVDYVGNASLGMYFWGAQAEAGAFPTSYIPTTTAAVTRSADSAVVTPISSFYNASEGTLFAEVRPKSATLQPDVPRVVVNLNSNSGSEQITIAQNNANDSMLFVAYILAGGGSPEMTGGSLITTTTQKVCAAYKQSDFAASFNGGAVDAETSGNVPSGITHMHIGMRPEAGTGALSGHIRKVAYYPRRLSNALLQSLTT